MIGIYNRKSTRINRTFIQNIMPCAEPQPKVCGDISELVECNIAIGHASEEDWDQLITKYSSNGAVRVRVTVGGNPFNKPPVEENGVYKFHLETQAGTLEVEDWQKILSGLSNPDIVKALVRGENPNGLRRFFVHEVMEYLSALTILCEGYLAVNAEDTDNISSALDLMGWTEFRKSERGQNLIQQDLSDKKSVVQCPQWWLNVFERESFDDDVKKEWRDTTGTEEIPEALNDLLEAIREGDTVVPPKIVADAYCVLVKEKIETTPSEWQTRRCKFNHDWLKNEFLNRFGGFIGRLQKRNPDDTDLVRMWEFLVEDFPAWKTHRQDAQWIVESFEDGMSPRRLLSCAPLSGCDVETREWLGHLVHRLWLSRYSIKEKAKESQKSLTSVNEMYDELHEKIACELEQSSTINLTQLIALQSQFCELRETYANFSKTLSNLPRRYESYGG